MNTIIALYEQVDLETLPVQDDRPTAPGFDALTLGPADLDDLELIRWAVTNTYAQAKNAGYTDLMHSLSRIEYRVRETIEKIQDNL